MQGDVCIHNQGSARPRLCTPCVQVQLSELRSSLAELHELIQSRKCELEAELLRGRTPQSSPECSYMNVNSVSDSVSSSRGRVSALRALVQNLRSSITRRREEVLHLSEVLESRRKKTSGRVEPSSLSFERYLGDPGRYDKSLSSMHPFRKLRSVAQSLAEERKTACRKLLWMFRFHQITVDGGTQLVPESSDDNSMTVFLLIAMSRVLDIWLPFPLVFGTLCSSPCLHSPASSSVADYPRILHAYKRVILPVTNDSTLSSYALLLEDVKYLCWVVDQGVFQAVAADPLQMLNQVIQSPNLGREIANPLQWSFPSSPSLSSSFSPSYRRSVIEQSVTEGGEWTLLDQL